MRAIDAFRQHAVHRRDPCDAPGHAGRQHGQRRPGGVESVATRGQGGIQRDVGVLAPQAPIRCAPTWQAVFVRVPLIAYSLVSGKSARAVNVRVEGRFVFDDIAAISGRLDGSLSPKVA